MSRDFAKYFRVCRGSPESPRQAPLAGPAKVLDFPDQGVLFDACLSDKKICKVSRNWRLEVEHHRGAGPKT
jgi:hypothetical protein